MSFLSATPDALAVAPAGAGSADVRPRTGAGVPAQAAAALVVVAGLTVPGAVVQAKWHRLAVIAGIVQHRLAQAVSA